MDGSATESVIEDYPKALLYDYLSHTVTWGVAGEG
ncbi:protein of unknown function [Pseudodesulfovibrio piezophilus C1TLV30]|uniref:Uncharacterized protein n=1 Tax=Pseudodesulfovibrio piezophilus (strain DSM 21447 / JCM 15486 / C1TLV30) TaxID=1322246 RepID=M1WVJ8_PSEP2|nr:protein of unknown function [Pseudodesulfovibrio piezophilus C1TLV30]